MGSIDFQKLRVAPSELQDISAQAPSYIWLGLKETKYTPAKVLKKNQAEMEVGRGDVYYNLMVKLQNAKKSFVAYPPSLVQKRYSIRAIMTTPGEPPQVIGEVANQLWQWNPDARVKNSDEVGADERYEGGQSDLKNAFFPLWDVKFVENGVLRVEVLDTTNNIGSHRNPILTQPFTFPPSPHYLNLPIIYSTLPQFVFFSITLIGFELCTTNNNNNHNTEHVVLAREVDVKCMAQIIDWQFEPRDPGDDNPNLSCIGIIIYHLPL